MNSIQNFQTIAWKRFWNVNIPNMFRNAGFTYRDVTVAFRPVNIADFTKRRNTHGVDDVSEVLKFNIELSTQERTSLTSRIEMRDYPFMQIPVFTQDGFVLKGTNWSLISDISPASGWYLGKDHSKSKMLYTLSLQKGSIPIIKLEYNPADQFMYLVTTRKDKGNGEKVPVLQFLKAMSPAMSFSEIAAHFEMLPIMTTELVKGLSNEPTIEACARNVANCIGSTASKFEDPVEILQNYIYKNMVNIGPERKIRFENFMSFAKAIGTELADTLEIDGTVVERGTVLTTSIIKRIEDAGVQQITVLHDGNTYVLKKCPIEDNITFREILSAVYNFCLFCEGLGKEDKTDNFCNKILSPVDAPFEKEIEDELGRISTSIRRSIEKLQSDSSDGTHIFHSIEGIINDDLLHRKMDPDRLVNVIKKASNSQQMEETNSLASLGQSYQVTRAAATTRFPAAARDVQKSQYGRVCPYTTSESEKVGINLSLSTMTTVDDYGFLCTPYYKVVNGRRTDEIVNVNPIKERGKIIASVELNLEENGEPIEGTTTLVKINGDATTSRISDIDYQELSPLQVVGPLISMIPSVERNAGKRLIMGVKAQQQSIPAWRRERPWLSTGTEAMMDVGVVRAGEIVQTALLQSDYDDAIPDNCVLQLINIYNHNSTCELIFKCNHPHLPGQFSYMINRMNATMKGSPKHQRVVLKDRNEFGDVCYAMDEIVVYNNDISIEKLPTSTDKVTFGKLSVPADTIQEHALALGNNIRVLFKSWEGSGYEDSVIVNEDFVNKYGLAIITTKKIEHILNDNEKFGYDFADNRAVDYMSINGLPKLGTFLKAGQDVIGCKIETDEFHTKWPTIKLDPGQKGYVISAEISADGKRATVVIGDILHLERGDKLAGMHGNKGVVGRIVPCHEMPFTVDGEVPDVILNPLGVVSRNNLGQMVEDGLSLIGMKTGVVQVLPPFSGTKIDEIIERSEELGLVEQDIYDGRTGRKFDKKGVIGVMHFLRLEHIATSKYNACSDGANVTNQRTMQLNKGPGGGQRISELTTWCLNSYGADHLFDTLWTVQSDDIMGRRSLVDMVRQQLPTDTLQYSSNNLGLLEAYFRILGLNIVQDENGLRIEKLTSQQIKDLSNGDCNLEYGDSSSEQSSYFMLRDPKVFGTWTLSQADAIESRQIYGRLPLCCELVMPIWVQSNATMNLLYYLSDKNSIEKFSMNSAKQVIRREKFINGWREVEVPSGIAGDYYRSKFNLSEDSIMEYPIIEPCFVKRVRNDSPENLPENTGVYGFTSMFKRYNVAASVLAVDNMITSEWSKSGGAPSVMDIFLYTDGSTLSQEEREQVEGFILKHSDMFTTRNTLVNFASTDSLANFIVDGVAVPPIGYRPVYKEQPATAMDIQLKAVVHTIKNLRRSIPGTNTYYDNIQYIYDALAEMVQDSPSNKDTANKTVTQELTQHQSKASIMRDTLLSKRITHSGRSVISVNSKLELGEAGIPISIASKILEDHIISEIRMNESNYPSIIGLNLGQFKKGTQTYKVYKKLLTYLANNNIMGFAELAKKSTGVYPMFNACKHELIAILRKLFETMPALLCREPSLHKFSIEGFKAIPVDSYAIELHPLACHGFNADFDGDQMMAALPVHGLGIKDVYEKMMMQDNLINPKDCELICSINQDMILGLYYATIFKGNKSKMDTSSIAAYYTTRFITEENQYSGMRPASIGQLYDDIMVGNIHVQDPVILNHDGRIYNSTAGRIMLNAMFSDMYGFSRYIKIDPTVELTAEEAEYVKQYRHRVEEFRKDFTDYGTFDSNDTPEFKAAITKAAVRVKGSIVYELLLDVVMDKGTVKKLSRLAVFYYSDMFEDKPDDLKDTLAKFLNRIMNYGFWAADYSGITLSLFDFNRLPISAAVDATMPEAVDSNKVIQQMYDNGEITESERKNLTIVTWEKYKNSLKNSIGDALNGKPNKMNIEFDPTDNIYMIVASGARGSTAQLMEISGIIGSVTNASNEKLETPITGNYMNGLSISEAFNNSYTSRRQVMAAQLSTASAGEKTRQLIYMAEHIHIRDSDRTCSAKPTRISLEYNVKVDTAASDKLVLDRVTSIPAQSWERGGSVKNIWEYLAEVFNESATALQTEYIVFADHIRPMLNTTLVDDDLKNIFRITLPRFLIVQSADDSYRVVFPKYALVDKIKYMLLYRCIDFSALYEDLDNNEELIRALQATRLHVLPSRMYRDDDRLAAISQHDEWPAISEAMLEVIENYQLRYVDIYTVLGCESERGICKRCFGVKYDSRTFPDNNEYIGYPAVQAIGEPTAQIVLDSHKSDDAGDGGSTLKRFDRLLENPNDSHDALLAPCDGVLEVQRVDNKLQLKVGGRTVFNEPVPSNETPVPALVDPTSMLVVAGTEVTAGTPLTRGKVAYDLMARHQDSKQVQLKFWRDFLDIFSEKIMARNFELIARSQSEFGVALENADGIMAGTVYPIQKLLASNVKYEPKILGRRQSSNAMGKILSSVAHSFFKANAPYHVINKTVGLPDSNIGRALIGDLKTAPFEEPVGVIKPQPRVIFAQENQQDVAKLMRRSFEQTVTTAPVTDDILINLAKDFEVVTELPGMSKPAPKPAEKETSFFDEEIIELPTAPVDTEVKTNLFGAF